MTRIPGTANRALVENVCQDEDRISEVAYASTSTDRPPESFCLRTHSSSPNIDGALNSASTCWREGRQSAFSKISSLLELIRNTTLGTHIQHASLDAFH